VPDQPLAYFITFHTYGTWLHGDAPGSVDREHNQVGTPWLEPNIELRESARQRMTQEPYVLDAARRQVVRDAIVAECHFRGWLLHALHVRSNHVHLVVTAACAPESVLRMCKSHASKCLNQAGFDERDRKRWAEHGSTRYLWNEASMSAAIEYTLYQQGVPMATFAAASED
jgi:REP element-mobilizing transposase RayT